MSTPSMGLRGLFIDEVIGVSDCLDSFGGFPIDVKTASVDV